MINNCSYVAGDVANRLLLHAQTMKQEANRLLEVGLTAEAKELLENIEQIIGVGKRLADQYLTTLLEDNGYPK